jgi:hypothetical protein
MVGRLAGYTSDVVTVDEERNLGFLGAGWGFIVLDTSTPEHPVKIGEGHTPDWVRGLLYKDSILYVANDLDGLRIFSIDDPAEPSEIGHLDTQSASEVALSGSYAYLADSYGGLKVISVLDPSNPVLVGNVQGSVYGVCVSGTYAYAATSNGLNIYSVDDPTHPTPIGWLWTEHAGDLAVSGTYAYLSQLSDGLRIVSVENPSSPVSVGQWDTPGFSTDVRVNGSYAFLADGEGGLRIISVEDPANPSEAGHFETGGDVHELFISGEKAYLADREQGLRILSIADPAMPVELGAYDNPHPGRMFGVDLSGPYAYVADQQYGLRVISIADPADPVEVGSYDTDGEGNAVKIMGSYAYLADGEGGLKIFSIADPITPLLVGTFDDVEYTSAVTLNGHYAFLSDCRESDMKIISVLDPSRPIEVSSYDVYVICQSVTLQGDYAYLAIDQTSAAGGIEVLFVQDLSFPAHVSFLQTRSTAWEIAIQDTFAYVADEYEGLAVISIADPSDLKEVAYYDSIGFGLAVGLALSNDKAYVASWGGGLRVVSIQNPSNPREVGYYVTPGAAWDVAIRETYAYVADDYGGFIILEYYGPTSIADPADPHNPLPKSFSLSQNYPNPFNPSTTIEVTVPEGLEKNSILEVYDMRGRLVKTLFQGILSSERRAFTWDGKDNRGLEMPAGVYLCTLRQGRMSAVKKMLLVR